MRGLFLHPTLKVSVILPAFFLEQISTTSLCASENFFKVSRKCANLQVFSGTSIWYWKSNYHTGVTDGLATG